MITARRGAIQHTGRRGCPMLSVWRGPGICRRLRDPLVKRKRDLPLCRLPLRKACFTNREPEIGREDRRERIRIVRWAARTSHKVLFAGKVGPFPAKSNLGTPRRRPISTRPCSWGPGAAVFSPAAPASLSTCRCSRFRGGSVGLTRHDPSRRPRLRGSLGFRL